MNENEKRATVAVGVETEKDGEKLQKKLYALTSSGILGALQRAGGNCRQKAR